MKAKDQSLAVAYAVKRKNKYAKGGSVKAEHRPMPDQSYNDSKMVSMNSGKKPLMDSGWTDKSTVDQAQKPSMVKLSRPKIMGSDAFSVRYKDEIDQEFQEPDGYKKQPPEMLNEKEKAGPQVSDMQRQHNNGMKPYAYGGSVEDEMEDEDHASIAAAIMAKQKRMKQMSGSSDDDSAEMMAEGGMVDIEENAEEEPNMYYRRNQEVLKENYDSGMMSQPYDSNLKGDEEEMGSENQHDMISRIRSKMRMK